MPCSSLTSSASTPISTRYQIPRSDAHRAGILLAEQQVMPRRNVHYSHSSAIVSHLNAQAKLPGPLGGQHTSKRRNATPVSFSPGILMKAFLCDDGAGTSPTPVASSLLGGLHHAFLPATRRHPILCRRRSPRQGQLCRHPRPRRPHTLRQEPARQPRRLPLRHRSLSRRTPRRLRVPAL